ncbi:MAG: DUF664 domain-containing protein [Trueperaceae bacterium]
MLDDESNSIGMLLAHIASVEEWYQERTLGLEFLGEALELRKLGGHLGDAARRQIRGHRLEYYLETLDVVRNRTLTELAERDDAWLYEESDWWGGQKGNNYFKWFHVLEDELNHSGQMRLIRKRLPG